MSLFTEHRFRAPRLWSNSVLRQIAPLCEGDVINVSGWDDRDKEGQHYRRYFERATSYTISNFGGTHGGGGDLTLDLEAELPANLRGRFDVVFNHTTLEHIFDIFTAVKNLCAMSRDVVIVVVPYLQEQHTFEAYSDYWRVTPAGLRALFDRNGMTTVFLSSTPGKRTVYHVALAARDPGPWRQKLDTIPQQENIGAAIFNRPLWEALSRAEESLSRAPLVRRLSRSLKKPKAV